METSEIISYNFEKKMCKEEQHGICCKKEKCDCDTYIIYKNGKEFFSVDGKEATKELTMALNFYVRYSVAEKSASDLENVLRKEGILKNE
jgi:hypothetical protein